MARPISATIEQVKSDEERPTGFSLEAIPDGIISVEDVIHGIVTNIPKNAVPQGSASSIVNGRVRDGWTESRPGTVSLTPAKPNSNKVYKIVQGLNEDGQPIIARFAVGSIHLLINGAWVEVNDYISLEAFETAKNVDGWWLFTSGITTGDTFKKNSSNNQLLDGTDALNAEQVIVKEVNDFLLIVNPRFVYRPQVFVTQQFNFLFTVDGVQKVGYINLTGTSTPELPVSGLVEGSPVARYITTFGERVVVASIYENGILLPNTVQWSANSDGFDWDSETAGQEHLIQGTRGFGNHITGVFGFEEQMIVLRMNSIWVAARRASGIAPFSFREHSVGSGCDLPYSAVEVKDGVMFADRRTRGVYMYSPGSLPIRVSKRVDLPELFTDLEDPIWVEGGYDPFREEYLLGITTVDDKKFVLDKLWIFSMNNGTWCKDDSPDITSIGKTCGNISVQEQLLFHPSIFKGVETGEIIYHDEDADDDWNGDEFTWEFVSPNIGSNTSRRTLKTVMASMLIQSNGNLSFAMSNDKVTWRNTIAENIISSSSRSNHGLRKQQITGDDLYWRFRCTAKAQLHSWWANLIEKHIKR